MVALLFVALVCATGAGAEEILVSNVFDNTFMVDALRDVSAQTGVPIVADATVQGQVTLVLENVPFEEALARIVEPGGYVFRKLDGYYLVGAPDAKGPSFAVLSRTETVRLKYAKAATAAKLLTESFGQYVKVDPGSNSLVLTAPDALLARIKADIAVVDRPIPQVMIEALVVDVSHDGRKNLGLDWGWEHVPRDPDLGGTGALVMKNLAADIGYIPADALNKFILNLKATCEKGEARVEANPRVATLDGQTAEIFVGRERYYNLTGSADSSTSARLESIKTGITLKMLPQVADNGDITVRIEPEVSDVVGESNGDGDSLPVISRRRVATTVRVKTGESIVLGGLLQRVEHKVVGKVPLLGDLPIIGALFRSTKSVEEEGEVLIIITPYLMDSPGVGQSPRLTLPSNETN